MVNKQIEDMLTPIGLPLAYREFKPYKNKPVPSPPYLIYLIDSENGYGADEKNLICKKNITVELYTTLKSPATEEKIEEAISGFEYTKYEDYISEEKMYMVSYEFTTYQKIRR